MWTLTDMTYQGLKNHTAFTAEPLLLADEQGRDVLVVLVKCTYHIQAQGKLVLAETQTPLCLAGEYWGEPGLSSLKYAPECAFNKTATDVALIAHAYAPKGTAVTALEVSLRVGPLYKTVRVIGDRLWHKSFMGMLGNSWEMSPPQTFTTMPLVYERAFGGKDTTPEKPAQHEYEYRNTIGAGLIAKHSQHQQDIPLPNLEDPRALITDISDRPPPAGFGFITPDCQPRLNHAGKYDSAWQKTRMPLLPLDFNPQFFNAAHPELIAPGFLSGEEPVEIINAVPEGKLNFTLPGDKPQVQLTLSGEDPLELEVTLDSVIINTDERSLMMLWRANANVYQRLYDIETVVVTPKLGMVQLQEKVA